MANKSHDIVGLGVIAVDDMLYVDTYPPANCKKRIADRRRQGGGNVSCALAAASVLGARCDLIGRLGDNELSSFARDGLHQAGVETSILLHDPGAEPLYCVIVVAGDTGSRSIYADYSAVKPIEPDELRLEWFAGAKVLLIDNMYPPAILPAVRLARQAGLVIVSDIEREMPELPEICRYIDHYVCSAEFALPHTGRKHPADACRAMQQTSRHQSVVVTAGEMGCYWLATGMSEVQHIPAHRVNAVDTTGCGDVFHGAFCYGLLQEWSLKRMIAFANAAAAVKATRTGGWAAVPTVSEVRQMLDNLQ